MESTVLNDIGQWLLPIKIALLIKRAVRLFPSSKAWIYDNSNNRIKAFSNTLSIKLTRLQVSGFYVAVHAKVSES